MTCCHIKHPWRNIFDEKYLLHCSVHDACNCIPFFKVKRLDLVIQLLSCMRPASCIWTYHVTSMTQSFEIKHELILYKNVLMAHANCHPIRNAFAYFKPESRYIIEHRNFWFQESCLILLALFWNCFEWVSYPYISAFKIRRKTEHLLIEKVLDTCSWLDDRIVIFVQAIFDLSKACHRCLNHFLIGMLNEVNDWILSQLLFAYFW